MDGWSRGQAKQERKQSLTAHLTIFSLLLLLIMAFTLCNTFSNNLFLAKPLMTSRAEQRRSRLPRSARISAKDSHLMFLFIPLSHFFLLCKPPKKKPSRFNGYFFSKSQISIYHGLHLTYVSLIPVGPFSVFVHLFFPLRTAP